MTMGRGIYVVCQWLLLVAIARLADPSALGQFTYALALTGPLIVFAQFNMRGYMATDSHDEFGFADYRNARLLGVSVALVVIVLLAFVRQETASGWLVVILVGLYKSFESISDIYFGALQKREAFKDVALSVAMHGTLAALGLSLALWWTRDLAIAVGSIAVAWLVLLLVMDIPRTRAALTDSTLREGGDATFRAIRACFPFGVTLTLMTLRVNVPVYFIEAQLGLEQVGYYSAVAYFVVAGRMVIGSLVETSAPRLARYFNGGQGQAFLGLLTKLLLIAAVLALAGVLGAALLGTLVLRIAYGAGYEDYEGLFVLVMIAAGVTYFAQLTGTCLTIARYRRMLIVSNVLGTVTVAACAAIFIPFYGLNGGALALLAGTLVIVFINVLAFVHAYTAMSRRIETGL